MDFVHLFRRGRDRETGEPRISSARFVARESMNGILKGENESIVSDRQRERVVGVRERAAGQQFLRTLRERFHALERIDFFDAPSRRETADSLAALEEAVRGRRPSPTPAQPTLSPTSFRGRCWVTRLRPGVDRMASAWLIRRFIDPAATFVFADTPQDGDVPFDMYSGDFSHQGDSCTFEVIARRFRLQSVAVVKVGQVVHDLDMKDTKFGLPEAAAVGRMVEGLQALFGDDSRLLEHGIGMFEALSSSFDSDERRSPIKPDQTGRRRSTSRTRYAGQARAQKRGRQR